MKKHTAFSLIELSIVILIIGILVAGVTQGSRLITRMKVASARAQTQSAPVNSIRDIVGWWETTLEQSFGGNEPEESAAGGTTGVATWYDINPQAITKNNATQATAANNPGYTITSSTTLNGLPTLQFNSSQYLSFDGTGIVGTNYSIFVVEQRTAAVGMGMMVTSSGAGLFLL